MATTTGTTTGRAAQRMAERVARVWTAESRRERSLELADERRETSGGMSAVRFVEAELHPRSGELAQLVVSVSSARDEYTRYQVIYDAGEDLAFCTCLAAQNFAPCWHAGQAILYGRYAADAYSAAGREATLQEQRHGWINEPPTPASPA